MLSRAPMLRRACAPLFVTVLLLTRTALGQSADGDGADGLEPGEPAGEEQAPAPPPPLPDDEDPPDPPLLPPALDTLAGHLALGLSGGWFIPFGGLESGAAQADSLGSGPGVGFDAGYGLSRTVILGVFGQAAFFGEGDRCKGCSTTSYAGGAFIRYHLVQGVRFDPWMSAGIGYRVTRVSTSASDIDYAGIEWLNLKLGGDWYAFDKLGFGPYTELSVGRYTSRSPGELASGANHWQFSTGARIVFDLPGK